MKKRLFSLLLALTMLLSMTSMASFAKVADATCGDFDYSIAEIYNEDFNGYAVGDTGKSFSGVDLDVTNGGSVVNPTKWEYAERGTDDTALKIYIDRNVQYDKNKPYLALSADSNKMGGELGEKAFINQFDVMFPEIPTEAGKNIAFATKVRTIKSGTEGTQVVQNAFASVPADVTTDPSCLFSFRCGGEYQNIVAEQWYTVTLIIDINEQMYYCYIDGELLGSVDMSDLGEIVKNGYLRIMNLHNLADGGMMIDNVHCYLATDVACELSTTGYVEGETGVGETVTFTVTDKSGEGCDIYYSTDETNWEIYNDTSYTLTLDTVYFKAVTRETQGESEVIALKGEKVPLEISFDGTGSELTEYQEIEINISGTRDEALDVEYSTDSATWTKFATVQPTDKTVKYEVKAGNNYIRVYDSETETYKELDILGVQAFPGTTLSCSENLTVKAAGDKVTINVSVMREDTTIYVSTNGRTYDAYTTLDKSATSFKYVLSAGDNYLKAGLDGEVLKLSDIAKVKRVPYGFSLTEPAVDFEGYTFSGSFKDANGNDIAQLGITPTFQAGNATTEVVADPDDETNTVWKLSRATKGTGSSDESYLNIGGLGGAVKSTTKAIVLSADVYVEEASELSGNLSLAMWKNIHTKADGTSSNVFTYVSITKGDADNVLLASTATFPEKEWHNIRYAFTPSDNMGYIYLDGVLVKSSKTSDLAFKSIDYIRTNYGYSALGTYYIDNWNVYENADIPVQVGEAVVGEDGKTVTFAVSSEIPITTLNKDKVVIYSGSNILPVESVAFTEGKMGLTVTTGKEIFTSVDITCEVYLNDSYSMDFTFQREAASYDVEDVEITEDEFGNVTATATVQNLDPVKTETMIMLLTLTNDQGVVEEVHFEEATLDPASEDVPITIANVPASGYDVKVFFCNGWTSLAPVKAVVYEK